VRAVDYTPHTDEDVADMLEILDLSSPDGLFGLIPSDLRLGRTLELGEPLSESEVFDLVSQQAELNIDCDQLTCFAGGGAYDHYVPAVVRALAGRSEFVTSYTPYQPELSQGVLGALFDYQSMICRITGMEVAGAGLYDGASALVEAVRLASGATGRKRVVISQAISPNYRQVVETLSAAQDLELITAKPANGGSTAFSEIDLDGSACLVVAQPNFFGCVEDVVEAADAAHRVGALLVVHFDPLAAGVLESPGMLGADVVTGEGQCLGNDLNFGGPYLGIFATHSEHIRRLPGRVCGATLDVRGNPGYVLTLQTREQHIRREKATSNICTDQTLMAITAGIYLSWLGPQGIREVGERCMALSRYAAERLGEVPGCRVRFEAPFLKEFVLQVPVEADEVIQGLAEGGYLAGPSLQPFPEMGNCLLVAVTERRTISQIDGLAETLAAVLS
jgi:glycine dehydrogenase subunit 1